MKIKVLKKLWNIKNIAINIRINITINIAINIAINITRLSPPSIECSCKNGIFLNK